MRQELILRDHEKTEGIKVWKQQMKQKQ
jgi:hypothetical protein